MNDTNFNAFIETLWATRNDQIPQLPRFVVRIRNRTIVAKQTAYGLSAKTYANRSQARAAAAKITGGVVIQFPGSRPFYIAIEL